MLCPHDQSVLQTPAEEATSASFCEICHGLWFSREQLAQLLRTGQVSRNLPRQKVLTQRSSQRFCPSCANIELSSKLVDKVEIDVCPCCRGIWLDAGELDLIITRYRRKQELNRFTENASDFLASDPSMIMELADFIAHALGESAEWGSEAASALLEFVGEVFSSIDF
jgi:Zn-finger nucleic acid-binding protein